MPTRTPPLWIMAPLGALVSIQSAAQPCFQWVRVAQTGAQPVPRWGHRMVYDAARRKVVMTTGYDNANFLSDTWEYDPATGQWAVVNAGPPPTPRAEGAMAYDSRRGRSLLYSGANTLPMGGHHQPGVLQWDGASWAFSNPSGPSARHGQGLAYDADRDRFVLYGSKHGENDTWEYEPQTGAWLFRADGAPDLPHSFFAMDYDAARRRTVLFGGYDSTDKPAGIIPLNQTWEWDGAAWARRFPPVSPSPRYAVGGVYDSLHRRLVIVGGSTGGPLLGETWSYDGATWTNLNVPGLPIREHPGVAFDSRRGRVVLFGGHDNASGALGDTWELRSDPEFAAQPQPVAAGEGAPAQFSVIVNASAGVTYQWRRDEAEIPGAQSPTLSIASVGPGDAGVYVCVVTGACAVIYSQGAPLVVLPPCPGDANGDRLVNFEDLNLVLSAFGQSGPGIPGDLNHDGAVNFPDLNLVLTAFGAAC